MSTRKSLIFSFLDRYASLAISIGSSMVIARLLTPAELGVYSVTMVLLMFVSSVRDLGAGSYLVQERDLTSDKIKAVWAIQLGLGFILAILVIIASYPAALFYQEPRMQNIMLVIALNYIINPFGSLTYAWLMREMRFESVALIRFASAVTGAATSIVLALQDFGPISLAIGSLISTLTNAMAATYFRPAHFPWSPGIKEIKTVLSFGSKISLSSIINVASGGAPELMLGKFQNIASVGYYSRANGLVQMFSRLITDAVGSVCLPWFSKINREKGSISESFLRATAYVTVIGWSFCIFVAVMADPIIRMLYGPQWDASANLARLLAAATVFNVPTTLCGVAILSVGAVSQIVRITIFNAAINISFVAVASAYSLTAVCIAAIAASFLNMIFNLRVVCKTTKTPKLALLNTLKASALVVPFVAVGPFFALYYFGAHPNNIIIPLLLSTVAAIGGFMAGTFFTGHQIIKEFKQIYKQMMPT